MQRALLGLTFGVIAVIGMPCLAAAQGGSAKSTLTGTVVDEGGAVLPGATVVVKNASTGVETTVVTNSTGAFDVPVLDAGTYVLTVSLEGFRTSMVTDLELLATTRQSTFMGLPTGSVAITVDGVSVQDKYTRSTDGFFANNQPRLDMVEEVTVSSATPGADSSGQGAVQIKFVMRSGTNRFLGSAYEYTRHPKLNSNTWFNVRNNLPKNEIILNQYGVREGGPIVIPGVFDGRGKAFFFFNVEQLRYPLSNTRMRNILGPLAEQGIFQYGAATARQQPICSSSRRGAARRRRSIRRLPD